jgi:hypothetical protein
MPATILRAKHCKLPNIQWHEFFYVNFTIIFFSFLFGCYHFPPCYLVQNGDDGASRNDTSDVDIRT